MKKEILKVLEKYNIDEYHWKLEIAKEIVNLFIKHQLKKIKFHAHLRNRCLMAFNEILFNHNADAVVLPEDQIKVIRKLIKDLQP